MIRPHDFGPGPAVALFILPTADTVFAERNDGWRLHASFDAFRFNLVPLKDFALMPSAGPAGVDHLLGLVDFDVGRIGRMGLVSATGGDYAFAGNRGLLFPRMGWRLHVPWSVPLQALISRLLTLDAFAAGSVRCVRLEWIDRDEQTAVMAIGTAAGVLPCRFYPDRRLHGRN